MSVNTKATLENIWSNNYASIAQLKDKQINVLIVDDEPVMLKLLIDYFSVFLTDLNIVITIANNGEEALEKIRTQSFNLLITDYDMPKLNGLELIQTIYSTERQDTMKIVLITGGGYCSDISKALSLSDAHAFKPIDFDHLTSTIMGFFNKSKPLENAYSQSLYNCPKSA